MELATTSRSRRALLRAAAGGSALLLGACGGNSMSSKPPRASSSGRRRADAEILNSLLDIELLALAAYDEVDGLLRGTARTAMRSVRTQEERHAAGLAQAIRELGGAPNRAKASYDLPELRSPVDALRFALDLESTGVAAYVDAIPKIADARLRATAASVLAAEGGHLSVLLDALGRDGAPEAFVLGKV